MNKMNIWHISDTHTSHRLLAPANWADVVIHSGDASNSRDSIQSNKELLDFFDWFKNLPVKHKIFVAGNHDVAIERFRHWPKDIEEMGITYLENSSTTINGIKIWGSPYTPTYGTNWSFQMNRNKTSRVWDTIPYDVDIVVTHGPPKGILDVTLNRKNELESVGDNSLAKKIEDIMPFAHLFGHIHNTKWVRNSGKFLNGIHYSNGSVVEDGKFGKLISNGNVLQISTDQTHPAFATLDSI